MAEEIVAEVEYRDIPGLEGYRVGSDGTVWSRWKRGCSENGIWRQLKGRKSIRGGYIEFKTRYDKSRLHKLHAIVLLAFVGPKPEGMECRHLNGNPADNRLSNLAWGTRKENVADSIQHGTFASLKENRRRRYDAARKIQTTACGLQGA